MIETQATICELADYQDGPPASQTALAVEAIRKLAALAEAVTSTREYPVTIVARCAAMAIVLPRLARLMVPSVALRMERHEQPECDETMGEAISVCLVCMGFLFRDAGINDRQANMPPDERTYCMGGQQLQHINHIMDRLDSICRMHGYTLQGAINAEMAVRRDRNRGAW